MSDFRASPPGCDDPESRVQVRAIEASPEIAARMQELQEAFYREMSATEVTGEAGAGMVRIRVGVDGDPKAVEVSPDLYAAEMQEPLEDLILAALQDAQRRSREASDPIRSNHLEKIGLLLAQVVEPKSSSS